MVRRSRSFLCQIINLLTGVQIHHLSPHPISLNRDFQSLGVVVAVCIRLEWSVLPPPTTMLAYYREMASDALGSWDCGGIVGKQWISTSAQYTVLNHLADDLSRNDLSSFLLKEFKQDSISFVHREVWRGGLQTHYFGRTNQLWK